MLEVRLPLPPTTNKGYLLTAKSGRAMMVKTRELRRWELVVAAHMASKGGQVPKGESLAVIINIRLPANRMRRIDLDGPVKFIVDAVVGARGDQWVDHLSVSKSPLGPLSDGYAEVRVLPTLALGP